jgi:hydroxymethylglutaryl-CoA lyase
LSGDGIDRLIVQEVAPRDGLQMESTCVATEERIDLIDELSLAGFTRIEAGSFVSPKAVPALRDSDAVFRRFLRRDVRGPAPSVEFNCWEIPRRHSGSPLTSGN